MKVELVEEKVILYPETQFEAQWLNSQAGFLARWGWFDDRAGSKDNLEFCGIEFKEVLEND